MSSSIPVPNPAVPTLLHLLRHRAHTTPHQLAYHYLADGTTTAGQLTYAQLDQQARTIAAELQKHQAAGERALLLYNPSLDYISAFMACLYAGVIAVPAYPPHPKRPITRIKAIMDDATAKFALTSGNILDRLGERLDQETDISGLHWIATDRLDPQQAEQWQEPAIGRETLAFLQYTSGSTSTPKGVMITHANLLWTLEDLHRGWAHTSQSVMVTWLPIFHDLGLIYGILTPLYVGFPCYLMTPITFLEQPGRWLQAITHFKGTHTAAPNFAFELCLRKVTPAQKEQLDLSSLQVALNAAEPVRVETLDEFTAAFAPCGFRPEVFCPGYGLAEATVKVSAERVNAGATYRTLLASALEQNQLVEATTPGQEVRQVVACGRSEIGGVIRIVNPDTKTICPPDAVGEIWVQSHSVAQGYWNRPEASVETFQAYTSNGEGPFLRTGDLGFYEENELYITGRIKDLLIIRGRNLYPHDLELSLEKSHPALRPGCGAAFSITVDGQEKLAVVYEVQRQFVRDVPLEEIVQALRQAVARDHEVQLYALALVRPSTVLKTSSGKIQRQGNKKAFVEGRLELVAEWRLPAGDEAAEFPPLPAPEVQTISDWVQRWLHGRLGGDDLPDGHVRFDQYGVDSITAIELTQDLITWLDRPLDLPAELLFTYPTPLALAEYVSQLLTQEPAAGETLPHAPEVARWLTHWLSQHLHHPVHLISGTTPFVELGVDSVLSVELAHDLDEWLPKTIDLGATVAWNYPTVATLSAYVAQALRVEEAAGVEVQPAGEELEALSEAELAELLGQELKKRF